MNPIDLLKIAVKLPISESTRRRNPDLCVKPTCSVVTPGEIKRSDATGSQRRQFQSAEDKLNQTEKKLLVLLRARFGKDAVRIQAIRLELAPGCTYLPDFSVWRSNPESGQVGHRLQFFECKGAFIRDDALVKLKTAARMYPEFDFWFCLWKNNRWTESLMSK